MDNLPWSKWYKPWTRCKSKYPAKFSDEDYYGRCELDKKHRGLIPHALDRGMDIPRWGDYLSRWE
jgi:hypothetical protein